MQIYIFSPIPYSFLHQRPQKLADQFVARSLTVTFIEPCGLSEYLAGRKRGMLRLLAVSTWYQLLGLLALLFPSLGDRPRPRRPAHATGGELRIVAMPIVVPANRVNSPFLERWNAAIYRQVLKGRIFREMSGGEDSLAIVQNPFWGLVLRHGDFSRITYDCIDEITLFSGRGSVRRFEQYERDLLEISDATYVTAEKLEERLRPLTGAMPLIRVPNGVDYDYFQEQVRRGETPAELQTLKKPLAGYVGVLRDWMDYDLLGHLARQMPDVSFVMVGPLDFESRIAHLKDSPNILWAGRKDYREMPAYINAFDVCLIPFLVGKVSMTTNPVKVFEYFALGKPVVSTPLYELEPFHRQGLLSIAADREAFVAAVRKALDENAMTGSERRREVARQHSWHALAGRMLSVALPEGKP